MAKPLSYWRQMAAAFEDLAERRLEELADVRAELAQANRRLAEFTGSPIAPVALYKAGDPVGELMSARLLIRNLRQQLRQRPQVDRAA